jgi:methionine synthase II (cobalamin-independent)
MMMDLSKLLRRNFLVLAGAGCRNIQIHEPLFIMSGEQRLPLRLT